MSCYYFVELLYFVTIMDESFFVSYFNEVIQIVGLVITVGFWNFF